MAAEQVPARHSFSDGGGFGYDAGWNMAGRSVNGTVTTYSVDDRNALSSGGSDPPYSYDGNGNLTSKGTGSGTTLYVYDDENRLIRLTYGSSYKTEYTYDGLGRLRVRTEYLYSAGWYVSSTTSYIYDGMRVVQERNSSNTPLVGYTRGKDLSGSLEGVGGIGGLLARSSGYSSGSWPTHHFYHADGNGNVTRLITTALATAASYKYDPYGRIISSSDSIGNVYRFSSKEVNLNSGIYYYGYRFYDPTLQRWLNRDPICERGGYNLYGFVANIPSQRVDPQGLFFWESPGFSPPFKTWHDFTQFLQYITPLGGRCKNSSGGEEWALVDGSWRKLKPGESTGVFEDCDGMTCGGGFYAVKVANGDCRTPGTDGCRWKKRRWTPNQQGSEAEPPAWDPGIRRGRGSHEGNTPPGYEYESFLNSRNRYGIRA